MSLLILVVDDEPDVEVLFRQQFRRDLRAGRFAMEFAQSAPMALQRIADAGDQSLILILSDINMPTAAQANVYTAAANRKRMTGDAARLLVSDQTANADVSHQTAPPLGSVNSSDG